MTTNQEEFEAFWTMLLEIRKLPSGCEYSVDFDTFKAYLAKAFMAGKVAGLHDGHRDMRMSMRMSNGLSDETLRQRLLMNFERIIS